MHSTIQSREETLANNVSDIKVSWDMMSHEALCAVRQWKVNHEKEYARFKAKIMRSLHGDYTECYKIFKLAVQCIPPFAMEGILAFFENIEHKGSCNPELDKMIDTLIHAKGYQKFDRKKLKVIFVGRDMEETLLRRFSSPKEKKDIPKYCCINNWIDENVIVPLPSDNKNVLKLKREYNLEDKLIIMYSGNIGLYYDLLNLIKVIGEFKNRKDVVFLFAGDGSMLKTLKKYVKEKSLTNVRFMPYQDKNKLVYSLNLGDVHFVVNAKGIKGVSVPSKLYGVMAVQKPVLGILEEGTEARCIIEESKCGKAVDPGDYKAIKALIEEIIDNKNTEEWKQMGKNGHEFLMANLKKDISIEKYRKEILSL